MERVSGLITEPWAVHKATAHQAGRLRLRHQRGRGGGLVLPVGRELLALLVVPRQAVDAGLHQNQVELGVLVLAVGLRGGRRRARGFGRVSARGAWGLSALAAAARRSSVNSTWRSCAHAHPARFARAALKNEPRPAWLPIPCPPAASPPACMHCRQWRMLTPPCSAPHPLPAGRSHTPFLPAHLQVLAHGHRLLDEVVQVLGDLGGQACRRRRGEGAERRRAAQGRAGSARAHRQRSAPAMRGPGCTRVRGLEQCAPAGPQTEGGATGRHLLPGEGGRPARAGRRQG